MFHISKILSYGKGILIMLPGFITIFIICMECEVLEIHQILSYTPTFILTQLTSTQTFMDQETPINPSES